jgi:hypothetical protein
MKEKMKRYYKIMLGEKRMYADLCRKDEFIGAYYLITEDLSNILVDDKDLTIDEIKKTYKEYNKGKDKIGFVCGQLWKVCKGINIDDIVISPDSTGDYYIGKIVSNYYFVDGDVLPHRRKVEWFPNKIERKKMSDELKKATKSLGTVTDITKYTNEIEALLKGNNVLPISNNSTLITEPNHLESSYEIAHRIKKLVVQINKNRKNRTKEPIFQDTNTMKIWDRLEEPCISDNDFAVFSMQLYILIYEKTRKYLNKDNRKDGFKFLLPEQFLQKGSSARHFFDIVGTLRHEHAHDDPEYKELFNKLEYKNILYEILDDPQEPPEDFYKFQIELLKRFENAMKDLLKIVKNEV